MPNVIVEELVSVGGYDSVADEIREAISECVSMPDCLGVIDFQKIRLGSGKTRAEWPDGYIHQAAIDLGLKVEL